jgi:hypothetical protein
MNGASDLPPAEDSIDGGDAFRWSVRLSDKAPGKRWVVLGFALAAGLVGTVVYDSLLLGALGFAIILAATAEFWMGARYRIDEVGATARIGPSVSSIEWERVKRVEVGESGVKLSPLERSGTRLEPFRGVYLRFAPEDRERVLEAVRRHVEDDVRFLG